jgi:hypothetical protein
VSFAGGITPVSDRLTAYRVLVRHGLIDPQPRKRPKSSYRRWERDAPMALWQLDIIGGVFLADGTEAKIVTGADDYSRYCVIWQVVARATGRAVCLAFAAALCRFGFAIEYTDSATNLRYYEPDFVAVDRDEGHYLIETKGQENVDVAHKDRAAKIWCENATLLRGVLWSYVKVPQVELGKLQPSVLADVVVAFGSDLI